jgi:hypothetical protein
MEHNAEEEGAHDTRPDEHCLSSSVTVFLLQQTWPRTLRNDHSTGESIHETAIHDLDALYSGDSGIHRRRFGGSGARRGATQLSGVGFFADDQDSDSASVGADFALMMSGDLDGCLYTFVETAESSPSGTYRETGRELFVASEGAGSFETTYRFEGKYEAMGNLAGNLAAEIFGRCQHPIVEGSGTGNYEGVSGRLDFKD